MAVVTTKSISMEYTTITSDTETKIIKTSDLIDKIYELVKDIYTKNDVKVAFFTDPMFIMKAINNIYGEQFHTWRSGANVQEERNIGSLIGKTIKDSHRNKPDIIGTVIKEIPTFDDDNMFTDLIILTDKGKKHRVYAHLTGCWYVKVGDKWLDPYDYADLVQAEMSGKKIVQKLVGGEVKVKRYKRRN